MATYYRVWRPRWTLVTQTMRLTDSLVTAVHLSRFYFLLTILEIFGFRLLGAHVQRRKQGALPIPHTLVFSGEVGLILCFLEMGVDKLVSVKILMK